LLSALVLLLYIGPSATFIASGLGAFLALISLFYSLRTPEKYPTLGMTLIYLVLHLVVLATAAVLLVLFLRPLSDSALKIPRLNGVYADPQHVFKMRIPEHWTATPLPLSGEVGVVLRPASQSDYMGVSEVRVIVRTMKHPPVSVNAFLEKMAGSFSGGGRATAKKQKVFEFRTETTSLLHGGTGVFSVLEAKRFWVPLRQVSLFGIKKKKYFCSISATGLARHAVLSKVLCLGLIEGIEISETTTKHKDFRLQ
jgi:hypothetical protein